MADCMTFPETLDEFLEEYQFKDTEEVYTNGSMLIPVFRVKQWYEHIPAADAAEVRHSQWEWEGFNIVCPECDGMPYFSSTEPMYRFCPYCGARMDGQRREDGDA